MIAEQRMLCIQRILESFEVRGKIAVQTNFVSHSFASTRSSWRRHSHSHLRPMNSVEPSNTKRDTATSMYCTAGESSVALWFKTEERRTSCHRIVPCGDRKSSLHQTLSVTNRPCRALRPSLIKIRQRQGISTPDSRHPRHISK